MRFLFALLLLAGCEGSSMPLHSTDDMARAPARNAVPPANAIPSCLWSLDQPWFSDGETLADGSTFGLSAQYGDKCESTSKLDEIDFVFSRAGQPTVFVSLPTTGLLIEHGYTIDETRLSMSVNGCGDWAGTIGVTYVGPHWDVRINGTCMTDPAIVIASHFWGNITPTD